MAAIGLTTLTVTIASGQSLSPEVKLGAGTLVGIQMPGAWTAAGLTFQASGDGGATFGDLHTSSAELSLTVAANQFIALDPTALRGVNDIKVRSGTSSVPVAQGADAVLTLILRTN